MGTTVEKLTKVLETKEAIRTAINNKGGTLTKSDTFANYPSAIDSLPSGGNTLKILLDATQSTKEFFYNYKGTSVDGLISYSDTANVTNMYGMFYNCTELTEIPALDTSKVTNMNEMFHNCKKITTIPTLDTSNVTHMINIFNSCSKLTTIPALDTSKVKDMSYMFAYCANLNTIPALDTSNVIDFSEIFSSCYKLTTIGMYGFTRSIKISDTSLTHDALVAFLNQAGTAYNSSQKITLGSKKLALLSDEEKAIATNKGWTLA